MPTKRTKENDIAISAAASSPVRRKSAITPRAKHGLTRAAAPEAEAAVEVLDVEITHSPTVDQIAALAYTYWAGRGYQGGSPEQDWLRAEQELRAKASA
ncbi:MAG: DUF2934 domain-containing protein [Bryobacteraceae bacterium]|jgi:hypothetical protein